MTYAQYRGVLACFAAAALCLLVGCLTLRPRTVFDRTGIRSAGPSVHATVRSSAGAVELGGMTTRAITEASAHYLMEDELDRIWAWAVFWGLVPSGSSPGNRAHGGERGHPSHH